MTTLTGTVKWFNSNKGYGFITPDDNQSTQGQEVFVHYSAIEGDGYRNLLEGDRVRFRLTDFGKGPQARSVTRLHGDMTMSALYDR